MADRIEIKKEDLSALYGRFRRNPNPPKPPVRQPGQHGNKLKQDWDTTLSNIKESRRASGIDTDNLIVIELVSDALSATSLDRLLSMCNLWIVEEVKQPQS